MQLQPRVRGRPPQSSAPSARAMDGPPGTAEDDTRGGWCVGQGARGPRAAPQPPPPPPPSPPPPPPPPEASCPLCARPARRREAGAAAAAAAAADDDDDDDARCGCLIHTVFRRGARYVVLEVHGPLLAPARPADPSCLSSRADEVLARHIAPAREGGLGGAAAGGAAAARSAAAAWAPCYHCAIYSYSATVTTVAGGPEAGERAVDVVPGSAQPPEFFAMCGEGVGEVGEARAAHEGGGGGGGAGEPCCQHQRGSLRAMTDFLAGKEEFLHNSGFSPELMLMVDASGKLQQVGLPGTSDSAGWLEHHGDKHEHATGGAAAAAGGVTAPNAPAAPTTTVCAPPDAADMEFDFFSDEAMLFSDRSKAEAVNGAAALPSTSSPVFKPSGTRRRTSAGAKRSRSGGGSDGGSWCGLRQRKPGAIKQDEAIARRNAITLADLQARFHLPLAEAASSLGICATILKRVCRSFGVHRWPHRILKRINGTLATMEDSLSGGGEGDPQIKKQLQAEYERLKKERDLMLSGKSAWMTRAMTANK